MVYTSRVHLHKLIVPSASAALTVFIRAVLEGLQSTVSALQDQESKELTPKQSADNGCNTKQVRTKW